MPRIRSIKPDFWTDEKIVECSTNARLLFIGLWNFCDDAGRMAFAPKSIKAKIFPADEFSSSTIRRMLDELSTNGLIIPYTVDNVDYLQVKGWYHQKIDRPQPSKIPAPDAKSKNHSSSIRRTFDERSSLIGEDRIGEEETRARARKNSSSSDLKKDQPEPPPPDGAAWTKVQRAYEAEIIINYGREEFERPFPPPEEAKIAKQIFEIAKDNLMGAQMVMRTIMQRQLGKGEAKPPKLQYFIEPIRQALHGKPNGNGNGKSASYPIRTDEERKIYFQKKEMHRIIQNAGYEGEYCDTPEKRAKYEEALAFCERHPGPL